MVLFADGLLLPAILWRSYAFTSIDLAPTACLHAFAQDMKPCCGSDLAVGPVFLADALTLD